MNRSRVTLYSFSFTHHGRYSSFHRLLNYSRGYQLIDTTSPFQGRLSPVWQRRLEDRWYRWSEWRLRSIFARRERQCVHYLYPENSLFRGTKWKGRHSLVLTCHQPGDIVCSMRGEGCRPPFWSMLSQADRVVLLSAHFVKDYDKVCNPDSIRVIPHGVDVTYFQPARTRPVRTMVLTIGNWLRDYDFWADVVLRLGEETPSSEFAVVALPNLLATARARVEGPLAGRISFPNKLTDEELKALYHKAAVLFLPLKDAGANNALLEAMASGLPVVVTDLPATREYAGDSAIYYSPGAKADCLEKLKGLLANAPLRAELGDRGRKRAETQFAWNIIAARYSRLYGEVLDETSLDPASNDPGSKDLPRPLL